MNRGPTSEYPMQFQIFLLLDLVEQGTIEV